MRRTIFCLAALLFSITIAKAAEPLPAPVPAAPAMRSIAAVEPSDAALHQYFYIDFPRRVQALEYERRLAEAEIALIGRRLETSRPSRSFGRYSATYTAELAWQIDLLAVQRRIQCLQDDEADLWRQRRIVAEALVR
jgi:hypothetical protein